MSPEAFGPDYALVSRAEVLTFEEITRLVRLFAADGVVKVRLTRGEPPLRRQLPWSVEMVAAVDGIEDLALITNSWLRAPMPGRWRLREVARRYRYLDGAGKSDLMALVNRIHRVGHAAVVWRLNTDPRLR